MTAWIISGALGFLSGGALIWLSKDSIMRKYKGAERFAMDLEDQIRSLKARLK
jgi:hypothetical protein